MNGQEKVKRLSAVKDLPFYPVLESGFSSIDDLRIFRAGAPDVILLAGSPGLGKSMLAQQIAYSVSLQTSVLYFSIEMIDGQVKGRVKDLMGGDLAEAEFLIVDRPGLSLWSMCNTVRDVLKDRDLGLIIVDYVQIMSAEAQDIRTKIIKIMTEFKNLAIETKVPNLTLVQFSRAFASRAASQENAKPELSDLGESSALEQWADAVLLMSQDKNAPALVNVRLAKNRHGRLGELTLEKNLRTGVFNEYSIIGGDEHNGQ